MAFSAAGNVSGMTLGKLLKIMSHGAVYPQLSTASGIWKKILVRKVRDAKGRESRYLVQTGFGPAGVQFTGFGQTVTFPTGQRTSVQEATALFKNIDMTMEYDLILENLTGTQLMQYAKPLADEMQAKSDVSVKILSAAALGDGSGAIGVVGSVTASTSDDTIAVGLSVTSANADRSHPGWFEYDDKVKFANSAGVAQNTINNTGTTVGYWQVTNIVLSTYTITLKPYTAAGVAIDITTATLGATDPAASDLIYRAGITAQDLDSISTNDYNGLSEAIVGLPSLLADDNRKVNGLNMTGSLAGSIEDAGGALLSPVNFQNVLSKADARTGGKTKGEDLTYSEAWMYYDTYNAMVSQGEANRSFFNVTDPTSGVTKIGHNFKKKLVEFSMDIYVPIQRIYILPDQKGPFEFEGHEFQDVTLGGVSQFLKPAGDGAFYKQGQAFMSGSGVLKAMHPAAGCMIKNFAITA